MNNKIFSDLDEDGQITEKDISQIVDRLTWKVISNRIIADNNHIDRDSKVKIAKVVSMIPSLLLWLVDVPSAIL